MSYVALKREHDKQLIVCLKRYIEILKLHVKEELTDDEKAELRTMSETGKASTIKLKEARKEYREWLKQLEQSAGLELEPDEPEPVLPTNTVLTCKLCREPADHDIRECSMNCCGTDDGSCLR